MSHTSNSDTESDFCPMSVHYHGDPSKVPESPSQAAGQLVQPAQPALPALYLPPPSPTTPILRTARAPHGYAPAFAPLFAYAADLPGSVPLLPHPVAGTVVGLTPAQFKQLGGGAKSGQQNDEEVADRYEVVSEVAKVRQCRLASPIREDAGTEMDGDGEWDGKEVRWEMPDPLSPLQYQEPLPSTLYRVPNLDALVASAAERLGDYDTAPSQGASDPMAMGSSSSAYVSESSAFEIISSDPPSSSIASIEPHVEGISRSLYEAPSQVNAASNDSYTASLALPFSFTDIEHAYPDDTLYMPCPTLAAHHESIESSLPYKQGSFASIDSWRPTRPSPARAVSGPVFSLSSSSLAPPASARSVSGDARPGLTPRTARKLDSIDAVYRAIRQGSGSDGDEDGSDDEVDDDGMPGGPAGVKMNELLAHMSQGERPIGADIMTIVPRATIANYLEATMHAHCSTVPYSLTVPPPRPAQYDAVERDYRTTIRYPNIAKFTKSSSPMDDSDSDDAGREEGEEDDVEAESSPSIRHSSPVFGPGVSARTDAMDEGGLEVAVEADDAESGDETDADIPLALRRAQRASQGSQRASELGAAPKRPGSTGRGDVEEGNVVPKSTQGESMDTTRSTKRCDEPQHTQRWSTRLPRASSVKASNALGASVALDVKAGKTQEVVGSDGGISDSDSDADSAYVEPSSKDRDTPHSSGESEIEADGSDADNYLPSRSTKRSKQSSVKLKRKAGITDLKVPRASVGQGERKREPDCVAKMESLRQRLMGTLGSSQESSIGAGGGVGYRGFDVRLCM